MFKKQFSPRQLKKQNIRLFEKKLLKYCKAEANYRDNTNLFQGTAQPLLDYQDKLKNKKEKLNEELKELETRLGEKYLQKKYCRKGSKVFTNSAGFLAKRELYLVGFSVPFLVATPLASCIGLGIWAASNISSMFISKSRKEAMFFYMMWKSFGGWVDDALSKHGAKPSLSFSLTKLANSETGISSHRDSIQSVLYSNILYNYNKLQEKTKKSLSDKIGDILGNVASYGFLPALQIPIIAQLGGTLETIGIWGTRILIGIPILFHLASHASLMRRLAKFHKQEKLEYQKSVQENKTTA